MSTNPNLDIDKLPFLEYARLKLAEVDSTITFDELVASSLTELQIEAQYGEETAINVGIARDPDDPAHWDDSTPPRLATEVAPHIVERHHRTRGKQKAPTKVAVYIRLDADIVAHFRKSGRGWQTRLNDTLRKAAIE